MSHDCIHVFIKVLGSIKYQFSSTQSDKATQNIIIVFF